MVLGELRINSGRKRSKISKKESGDWTDYRQKDLLNVSTGLSSSNFHPQEAECQLLKYLMERSSADCLALLTSSLIKNVQVKDKNDKKKFTEVFTNILSNLGNLDEGDKRNSGVIYRWLTIQSCQYQVIRVPSPDTQSCLFFVYNNADCALINKNCKWLKENELYINSLLSFLDQFHEESIDKHSNMKKADSQQKEVLEQLTKVFESQLLKRGVKKNCDNLWDKFGRNEFKKGLWYYVENDKPILFLLPAFPFKSSNTKTKVLGTLPDLGEKLALQRLENFLLSIKAIYAPGARLVIYSDGRVYCDLFRISDAVTTKFKSEIRRTYVSEFISWSDLDVLFSAFNDKEKRYALDNLFGTTPESINDQIQNDSNFREIYCGFKKFMTEELALPELSCSQRDKIITATARGLVMRNYSYGLLMKLMFPRHVRLSIHPSSCTTKFSVNLVGNTDWGTPWHNCALLQPDGTWSLIRRNTAEEHRFKLSITDDGLPFFINDRCENFMEQL